MREIHAVPDRSALISRSTVCEWSPRTPTVSELAHAVAMDSVTQLTGGGVVYIRA